MFRKFRGTRPLLRMLVLAAVALLGLDIAQLLGTSTGERRWFQLDPAVVGVAVAVVLVVIVLVLARQLTLALDRAESAARLQHQLLDALHAGIVLFDADGRIAFCNEHFSRTYAALGAAARPGATYEQLLRAVVAAGMAPESAGGEEAWIAQRLAAFGRTHDGLMRRFPDGSWRRIVEQRLPDGAVLAHIVDVSAMVAREAALDQARQELAHSRQLLEDAIEALPAGFELYDADDRLVMVNRMNLQMYPLLADIADKRPTFEQVVRTNAARGGLPLLLTGAQLDAWIERRLRERRQPTEPFTLHQTAENRWIRAYERRMRDGSLVAIRLDVTELMQREQQLNELNAQLGRLNQELSVLSQTDPLTGLANRRAFDARLSEEVSRALRHGMPLALLLVDVDHFKQYNDRYGHPAGDACLRQLAALLRDCAARPTDLVARLGGEEFALLLPHHDATGALAVARRCVQAVAQARIAHDASSRAGVVTVSIGAAELRGDAVRDAATLLAAADDALYRAKQDGRNRAVLA